MLLFLITPWLVVAVQFCMEWIPIKKRNLSLRDCTWSRTDSGTMRWCGRIGVVLLKREGGTSWNQNVLDCKMQETWRVGIFYLDDPDWFEGTTFSMSLRTCFWMLTKMDKHDFLGGYCEQKGNHLETFAMLELKLSIFMSLYFFRIAW